MPRPRPMRAPAPVTTRSFTVPAPMGGLNTVGAGLDLPATDCISAVNLMSSEQGVRARLGWREYARGLTGTISNEVRSILPFTGSSLGANRVFACTDAGIFNASPGGSTVPQVATFPIHSGNAGYGVSCVHVTSAGHFLLYADEVNGYWVYAENGGTWTKVASGTSAGQVSGINPDRIAFVTVFKNRVWFVERETTLAWYLPPGQVFGVATSFPMGRDFKAGGALVGLWGWTYDGGAGLDDSMVAVSSGGDVLVYQGTDPGQSTSWGLKGSWYVGPPPVGRRIANGTGGELLLLSRQGLVPMSKLVVGASTAVEYASAKVSNLLNRQMVERSQAQGWAVVHSPEDNTLLLLQPRGSSGIDTQLAQGLVTKAWYLYQSVPMLSAAPYQAQLFFGTRDGRVGVHTGYVDEYTIDALPSFKPVQFSLLTGFSTLGTTSQKLVQLLRPQTVYDSAPPALRAEARYEFDAEAVFTPAFGTVSGDVWGKARWGVAKWGGRSAARATIQTSAAGIGASVAIAISGKTTSRMVLVAVDVLFETGGFL